MNAVKSSFKLGLFTILFGTLAAAQLASADTKTSLEYTRETAAKAAAAKPGKPGGGGECTDTGEVGSKDPIKGPAREIKSGSFPCSGNSKAKDDAMQEILDALGIDPPPGCTSGGCDKRKSCAMEGLLSPAGDPVDFAIVDDGNGQCHYSANITDEDKVYMKAACGCR